MILSILATVAVLAAIAVITAALVSAETFLVYVALGLGGLSVLLLLGALVQGRFGVDRTETARTDGLGKSSVPGTPDPTWRQEESGRVPAPVRQPVRATPVSEPSEPSEPAARTSEEEAQDEPEFEVPRWQTPTVDDWPESASPEDEYLQDPEDSPEESVERDPSVEETETATEAASVPVEDEPGRAFQWSEITWSSDAAETAEPDEAVAGPEGDGGERSERSRDEESDSAAQMREEPEEGDPARTEAFAYRLPESAPRDTEPQADVEAEPDDEDEPHRPFQWSEITWSSDTTEPAESAEDDPERTASHDLPDTSFETTTEESTGPAHTEPEPETDEPAPEVTEPDEAVTDPEGDGDEGSERPDTEEATESAPAAQAQDESEEEDPDQTAVLNREARPESSELADPDEATEADEPVDDDTEEQAVSHAASIEETPTDGEADAEDEAETKPEDEARERGSDRSHTD